ncbi:MAG: helix-turn-helix transcriptional regulator [Candidatus Omnitrophica bacterium]|nr:helix-turn-helix transcriptional regulator [Candidatus Omnitrophota bacterium]
MKVHEKIKLIREDLKLSLHDVYERGVIIFGDKALSYRTLHRIEGGQISKFSSILKICCALGVPLENLIKDTQLEGRLVIRNNERIDEYTYNDKVLSSVISSPNRSFLCLEMSLEPKGKTAWEHSPLGGKYEKWIYIIKGTLTCFLGEEKFVLDRADSISFDSSTPHCFENAAAKPCLAIVIVNPKYF